MSFQKLEPLARDKDSPRVTAAVNQNRFGIRSIHLRLNRAVLTKFGAMACDVSAGEDDDEGRLLLSAEGKTFSFGKLGGKGAMSGIILRVPCPSYLREETVRALCTIEELAAGRLVIALPLVAWADPAPAPPPAPPSPASPPPAQGKPSADKLDVVTYLKAKGRDAERTAGAIYVDGHVTSLGAALRMVNGHRQDAGFDGLTLDKVW